MSQPPQFPPSSGAQGPQHSGGAQQPGGAQHPGGTQVPPTPQQGGQGTGSGAGKGPILAAVGCGLLVLVLVLALVGFFGMRAWMGDDDRGEQTSAPQEESPAEEEPAEEPSTAEETTAEETYRGPGDFSSYAFVPVDYVAADGTPYEEAGVVTPASVARSARPAQAGASSVRPA